MIPKLSTDPLAHISSFLGNKDKHAFSQVCTTIKPIPFSPNASPDKALFKHMQGIASAKRTVWTLPEIRTEFLAQSVNLYCLDGGQIILRRNSNHISSYSKDGKEIYHVKITDLTDYPPTYIGSNKKFFFYGVVNRFAPAFIKIVKTTGEKQTIAERTILPAASFRIVKVFSTANDDKGFLIFQQWHNPQVIIVSYDFAANRVDSTSQVFPAQTFFKLKDYLYLIGQNSTTVLNMKDQLKPVNCNVPILKKIQTKGGKIFDFSTKDLVTCYSNDDQGNVIQEWQSNVEHDIRHDIRYTPIHIVVSKPFIALSFDFCPIAMSTDPFQIAILDGENGGKVVWKKNIKREKSSDYPVIGKFFQNGILSLYEKNAKKEGVIKFLYFHPKSKQPDILPSITPTALKNVKKVFLGHQNGLNARPDLLFLHNEMYFAHSVVSWIPQFLKDETKIEKFEFQDKTANLSPIITKIGGTKKRTWKNIIKFLFRRIIRNVCECAKRVFCCKK